MSDDEFTQYERHPSSPAPWDTEVPVWDEGSQVVGSQWVPSPPQWIRSPTPTLARSPSPSPYRTHRTLPSLLEQSPSPTLAPARSPSPVQKQSPVNANRVSESILLPSRGCSSSIHPRSCDRSPSQRSPSFSAGPEGNRLGRPVRLAALDSGRRTSKCGPIPYVTCRVLTVLY